MKKGLTELVFVLDRSGSMAGLEKDTVGGYNTLLKKNKEMPGEAHVSTVLFNQESKVLHDRVDIQKVDPLTERDYVPMGCTALLDAVGGAVRYMGNVQRILPDEYKAEHVLVVIATDGYENASRTYTYREVKSMIERQREKYGWEFIFLGANIDVASEAGKLGVAPEFAAQYSADERGTEHMYDAVCCAAQSVRATGKVDHSWRERLAGRGCKA